MNMTEKLLTRKEVARRLGMSYRTFSRHKAKLIAMGLMQIRISKHQKFRESSLNKLITKISREG